ncbi:MAG: hypothetical protein QOG72_2627 [Sphingomonadales bacterium]|nr:hypothetical protein [Sphingomonadales bacterium]
MTQTFAKLVSRPPPSWKLTELTATRLDPPHISLCDIFVRALADPIGNGFEVGNGGFAEADPNRARSL